MYGTEQRPTPPSRCAGQPSASPIDSRCGPSSQLLSASTRIEARLFFLDKPHLTSDDLALADIIATGVGLLMAESRLEERLRESAAFEERVRLARDLHDGVLQSLTGIALQLETARRLLEGDVPAARGVIETDPAVADRRATRSCGSSWIS